MSAGLPVGALEKVEALFANPALYELADLVPEPDRTCGGRPRHYPTFMALAFDALLSVFGSARQVEAEIAHPLVWRLIRDTVAQHRPELVLPDRPMRKHHHRYLRDRYLTDAKVLASARRSAPPPRHRPGPVPRPPRPGRRRVRTPTPI